MSESISGEAMRLQEYLSPGQHLLTEIELDRSGRPRAVAVALIEGDDGSPGFDRAGRRASAPRESARARAAREAAALWTHPGHG